MVTYSEKTHKIVTDKTFILEPEIKVQTRSLNSPEQLKNCEWGLILNEHGKYCRAHCSSESLNSELCAVRDEQRVHPQRDRKSPPSSEWGPLPFRFPMAISYWCHQEEEIDSLSLCFQELRSGEKIAFISLPHCSPSAECSCKLRTDTVSFSEERRWKTREKCIIKDSLSPLRYHIPC